MIARVLAMWAVVVGLATAAAADPMTVGLFCPTAPFPSTSARLELTVHLADAIGKAIGTHANGKVFARAGDFAAAVKKGGVQLAVVDAAYLASAGGSYTVIAAVVRGGETQPRWQLVARGGAKLAELTGKRLLVPAIGGRESEFVLAVLLGGEVTKDHFAKIEPAPDTASTLAALGLGKAEAAVVPEGVDLPAGVVPVLGLPAVQGPLLVAYGAITPAQQQAIAAAVGSFTGDATVASFQPASGDLVQQLARRFTVTAKRGPLAMPALRLLVGDLVEGRTLTIERAPVTSFAIAPDKH